MRIPVARIEAFASADPEAKIPMQCVYLDRDGGRLLATDGHAAARISVEMAEGDVTGLVPVEVFDLARKELKLLRKALGKDTVVDTWLRVECGEDAAVIENLLSKTNHIVNRPKLLDLKFPNIDAVFPDQLGLRTVTLSRDLLAALLPALDGDGALSVWIAAPEKPVFFTPDGGQIAVVMMPMRGGLDGGEALRRGEPGAIPPLFGDEPAPVPQPDPAPAESSAQPSRAVAEAIDRFAKAATQGGTSVTLSIPSTGQSVTIDPKAAETIHANVAALKRKQRSGKGKAE